MPPSPTKRFLDEVGDSVPPGLSLPPAFASALLWMEENGCVGFDRAGKRYSTLYPAASAGGDMTCVSFHPVDPRHAAAWIGKGVPGAERLAPFIRTGGDGSYAALWLGPDDRQSFVHLGSGSGSTWAGVITDDPVEMLRFLAIGYPEPCWPEAFGTLPVEADDSGDEASFAPPRLFQRWLTATFGVTVPARGCDVVGETPDMDDDEVSDPFLQWLRGQQAG